MLRAYRVQNFVTGYAIWKKLETAHEGTSQVKARLRETFRREYEVFTQKPGESIESMFSRFQSIVNKVHANSVPGAQPFSDHEKAIKLLYALDRKEWEVKVETIIESASYDTLTVDELFSKLKAREVDSESRAKLDGSSSKNVALVSNPGTSANPNPLGGFALSSLASVTEEQMEVLDDEDLALVINKFQRFYQNRKGRKKGERTGCFNCGDPSHFVADCPKKKREEYDYPRHKGD